LSFKSPTGRPVVFTATWRQTCTHRAPVERLKHSGVNLLRPKAVPEPVFDLAAAEGLRQAVEPFASYIRDLNTPAFVLKYFHGLNMAIVLFAMGYYGCGYLGWNIRLSNDSELKLKARDLHPKLAIGMTIFFALGATGGLSALVVLNKPIFESAHVWTAISGLTLLGLQGMLSLFFEDDPSLRQAHAYFGSAILMFFTIHLGLGIKLALSL